MTSRPSVVFSILARVDADPHSLFWYAQPRGIPDERAVIWRGLPPAGLSHRPEGIAPVVLAGGLDGSHVYVERLPRGIRLDEVEGLPPSLRAYVGHCLDHAIRALHRAGRSHGTLEERHVVLGCDGDVVLIGRGRRGSSRDDDLAAVERLAPRAGLEAGSRAELARWVCTRWVPEPVLFEVEIQAEQTVHLDEVVPDIGPDPDAARGLLDGWATTTSSGSRGEVTAEVTETGSNTRRLAMLLWARMVSGGDGPPPERFVQVDGQPSRGIRALVTELGVDPVPVALGIGPGVLVSGISSAGAETEDPTLTLPYEELASFEDPEDTAVGAVTADPRENTITETATRSSVGLTAAIGLFVVLALLWLLWVG